MSHACFSHMKTHAEIVQAATEKVKEENESKDRRRAISLDRRYESYRMSHTVTTLNLVKNC